ncbi:MAG: hypothetical protein ACOX2M_04005 [Fastidiosipilaceae bacterium]|jgi:hypothetical protein
MKRICEMCGKNLDPIIFDDGVVWEHDDLYTYRGRTACGDCLDDLRAKVDHERSVGIYRETNLRI